MITKRKQNLRLVMHMVVALYGLACLWLFYHQSVADLSVEGAIPYQSDLPLHISMIVEDGWYLVLQPMPIRCCMYWPGVLP